MTSLDLSATDVGGPTAILDVAGLRFITDPTFDAANIDYSTPAYTLHKSIGPAVSLESVGSVDAVLLSHDHHFDNLDRAGIGPADRLRWLPPGHATEFGGV